VAKIEIYDAHCVIQDENHDVRLLWKLDDLLSFKVMGHEHMASYKGFVSKDGTHVKWDGCQRMLDEHLHFPIGLLPRVKEFLEAHNRIVELDDRRSAKSPSKPIDIMPTLHQMQRIPYPYQSQVVDAIKTQDRGIVRMATGGGKTLTSALMIASFGKKTILYVIGCDLLYQTHKFFESVFKTKIGLIGDGNYTVHDINVASVWTIGQALGLSKNEILTESDDEKSVDPSKYTEIQQLIKEAKVHIFDECHLAACNTIQEICRNIQPEHIYGMSASPWRDDGADLLIESVLGRKIVDISASQLIDGGFLVQPFIKFQKVPPLEKKIAKAYQTIYKNYITDNPVRNGMVVRCATKLVEQGYQTLVLFNSVAHGTTLYNEISKLVPCVLLSGKDSSDAREEAKKKLESGEIRCVIASKIFDIGVDLPTLSGLVIAGGGKSSVRALQRIGRVIRKSPNKKRAVIIDFHDQAHFLKDHSKDRFKIYSMEERFDVTWAK
jgi:superfamily II DNA or RNA helicase